MSNRPSSSSGGVLCAHVVEDGRPPTRDLPFRTNRWYYRCPPCGSVTEHKFLSWMTDHDNLLVISWWSCNECGTEDYRVEEEPDFLIRP